jgi:hypothetical protein
MEYQLKLLTDANSSVKMAKNLQFKEYLTFILYLAPHRLSGTNVCPGASPGCIASCLNSAGRGVFQNVKDGRMRKTRLFLEQRETFLNQLCDDIRAGERKANREGKKLVIRLNGTSDIDWRNIRASSLGNIFQTFPNVQFYDYTKVYRRVLSLLEFPIHNYDVTFSRSECNENEVSELLKRGGRVAVVFVKDIPRLFKGIRVVNGDNHDLRFLDGQGIVSGLKAKGKARRDTSGFVV